MAFKLLRDVYIFTSKRLILVDKQGLTGKKVEMLSIPYRAISRFSVETAGHFDLDAELKIWISSGVEPAIGPLTEVTDAAGTRYVRYLGTWKVVDGTPTFVRATGEDGAALPPAETLTPTFVQLLFRQTSASGSSGHEEATGIGYVRVPVFFPGQPTGWMTRQTPTLQDRLAYTAPLSETDTGSVSAASTKLSYFSDEAPTPGPAEELFLVQVEEANEAAHYSTDAGGN